MASSVYPKYLDKHVDFLGADAGGKPMTTYNASLVNWLASKLRTTQGVLGKNFGSLSSLGISGADTANDIIQKRCMFDVSSHTISQTAGQTGYSQSTLNFSHTSNGGAAGDQRFLPNIDPIVFISKDDFFWGDPHSTWAGGTQTWYEINDVEILKDSSGYPYAVRIGNSPLPTAWDRTVSVKVIAIQGWEH